MESNRIELDRTTDDVIVVLVEGEHDVYTAPTLRERLQMVIDEGSPFVIDLTPATFVDSSVLRVLLEARRRAHEKGIGFAVALEQGNAAGVQRVLEVTGLMPVFPVLPARETAVEAAKSRQPPT